MKISIIGASAGVGLETVERALARGHAVTTLSRSEVALPESDRLTMVLGSATEKADLRRAITGADAVIVALGTGTSTKATTLFSDAGRLLVELQREEAIAAPLIVLTGFGAGESGDYVGFAGKLVFRFVLNKVYKDKTLMEELITASDVNWEIVRPGLLKNKPLTEQYRAETRLYKGIGIGSINRADVADFMVKQAEDPTLAKNYVALSNT
ncbi:NAD(P)-dependent oxidoreductase [Tsukamurella spumae]|uniref:NAD(P)H-binding protein n=1 Tax=Tsukamurella spumae TaxID=44753 RepID=A0A846X484_9ACTN|nr:NAD(P)H-binding protein [Tsukamurella spumae]NKY20467.1 NAD(P)H-binding protein [Tsukamurella spumae]